MDQGAGAMSKAAKRRAQRNRAAERRAAANVKTPTEAPRSFVFLFVLPCVSAFLVLVMMLVLGPPVKHDEWSNADSPTSMPPWRQAGASVPWHAGISSSEMISKLSTVADLMNKTASSQLHWLVNKLDHGRFARSDLILLHPDGPHWMFRNSSSMRLELERAIRGINLLWRSFVEDGKPREEIIRERIKAAAKSGLTLQAVHPFWDGNKRLTRRLIALMLVRALGFQIQLPESHSIESSRGWFVFTYMIHHSLQQQNRRLNSSDYAAFLLDCAYDTIDGVDVDSSY